MGIGMKFYYVGYSVRGLMPDGRWRYFATEEDYREAYEAFWDNIFRK